MAAEGRQIDHRELAVILDEVDDLLLPYTLDLSNLDALNHAEPKAHMERVGTVFYDRGDGEHTLMQQATDRRMRSWPFPPCGPGWSVP